MKKGRLEVITGCMSCGKTEELIRRIHRAKIARQRIIVFKPQIDDRSEDCLKSRSGLEIPAQEIEVISDILIAACDSQVVGIDEAQFFSDLIPVVDELINQGKRIIVSGLDTDFRGEPFGDVPFLISLADSHLLLPAVCVKCGSLNAIRTQRIINGQPASYNSPLLMIGGDELYEARCRDCHEVPGKPKVFFNKKD
jgi:thymidine kinase